MRQPPLYQLIVHVQDGKLATLSRLAFADGMGAVRVTLLCSGIGRWGLVMAEDCSVVQTRHKGSFRFRLAAPLLEGPMQSANPRLLRRDLPIAAPAAVRASIYLYGAFGTELSSCGTMIRRMWRGDGCAGMREYSHRLLRPAILAAILHNLVGFGDPCSAHGCPRATTLQVGDAIAGLGRVVLARSGATLLRMHPFHPCM